VNPVSTNYNKVLKNFIFIECVLNLVYTFVAIHRHFVLYGLMEYLSKRYLSVNYSITATMKVVSSDLTICEFLQP
jgi:hypothetical protein